MTNRELFNRIRLVVGLPLVGACCSLASASGQPANAMSAQQRVVTFAGEKPLGIPKLEERSDREAWVKTCLSVQTQWPERCDLREVMPYDPTRSTDSQCKSTVPPKVSLFSDFINPEPIHTMTWELSHGVWSASIDAHSGKCLGAWVTAVTPGRPFANRTANHEGNAANPWVQRALEEHASVAAFARHIIELMALGAPVELLQAVTRAQADEVRHTQLCLERARAQGFDVQLGPLDTDVPQRTRAFDIAMGVALEGCINETLSASELGALADNATGEDARVLGSIADDELEHAALAWRTLGWLMPRLTCSERRRVRAAMYEALPTPWYAELAPCIAAC